MTLRSIAALAAALIGTVAGLTAGACCPPAPPRPLESTVLITDAFAGSSWRGRAIDDVLRVDVDMDEATVALSFASEGSVVIQRYSIVSTEETDW